MRLRKIFLTVLMGIALSAAVVSMTGCKFLDWLTTETGQTVVQEAGEISGIVIGFENQGDIEDMVEKVDGLLLEPDEALKEAALKEAYEYVFTKYGHNKQTAYLMSKASKLIGIVLKNGKLEFLANYKIEALDSFLVAFRNGLIAATPRYNRAIIR